MTISNLANFEMLLQIFLIQNIRKVARDRIGGLTGKRS